VSDRIELTGDVALARAIAAAALSVPGVAALAGEAATLGPNETVRGVAIDRGAPDPAASIHMVAEYRRGENLLELAGRVRRKALRAAAELPGGSLRRIDVTVHDIVVPAEIGL
jgi:uncharacterized alkaline shock family protein YloU